MEDGFATGEHPILAERADNTVGTLSETGLGRIAAGSLADEASVGRLFVLPLLDGFSFYLKGCRECIFFFAKRPFVPTNLFFLVPSWNTNDIDQHNPSHTHAHMPANSKSSAREVPAPRDGHRLGPGAASRHLE